MADEQGPIRPSGDRDSTLWLVLGAARIVTGIFFGARSLGIVPWPVTIILEGIVEARSGIGVLLVGLELIIWARSDR